MVPVNPFLKADVILVFVALLAAFGWIFSKEALVGLPPLLFIGMRFFAAGVVLVLSGRTRFSSLTASHARSALLSGLLFSCAISLWILGLKYSEHLGVGAFLTSLAVVLVPMISRILYGEQSSLSNWLALPVAFTGLALLALKGDLHWEGGQLFFVIAALFFALLFTYTSQVVQRMSAITLTAIQLLSVGVVTLLLSLVLETWPQQVETSIWAWLLTSTLIATSMRFFLQIYAQSLAPASHTAVILIIEPVLTSVAAAIWFGERMTALQGAGCGLIFTALVIARWPFIRKMLWKRQHFT